MRRFFKVVILVTAVGLIAAACVLFGVYRASQQVPEFYQAALEAESLQQIGAGDELEQHVLELHNELNQEGRWEATFTEQEINGWLAVDLPEKFPDSLPRQVQDPRVAIRSGELQAACRFTKDQVDTVLSFSLQAHLTGEPNVLAVHIRRARAGVLPLPLNKWLDQITKAAHQANVPLRWTTQDGKPVALVSVPVEHEQYDGRQLRIDALELRDREVYLAGNIERIDPSPGTNDDQPTPPSGTRVSNKPLRTGRP